MANLFVVEGHPEDEWDERIACLYTFYDGGHVSGLLLAAWVSQIDLRLSLPVMAGGTVVAAVGFVIAAVALLAGWGWWQPALVGAVLGSLALTILDWGTAFASAILNSIILVVLWLGPRIAIWFSL